MNISYKKHILNNGLTLLFHENRNTPMVAVNVLYKVGARNESKNKTGMAHLFEHLMFGGSINIPNFDKPLQDAGGENNAFTNNDITNYYCTLPAQNIETAFWLESDRMLSLAFTQKSLRVQKNVVIEEFRQRYLNQPYGDVMLHLRPLIYQKHPYQWATIGKEESHIAKVKMNDIKDFFFSFYAPNNAILSVVGNISFEEVITLTEKWFGDIPSREIKPCLNVKEPKQSKERILTLKRDVPSDALYIAFKMPGKTSPLYPAFDLLSDILGGGQSSRLYTHVVENNKWFSDISCYISGSIEIGFLIIEGKLLPNVKIETAHKGIREVIQLLTKELVAKKEFEKVKNKAESTFLFQNIGVSNIAMNLAYYESLGDASLINYEMDAYKKLERSVIKSITKKYLNTHQESVVYYLKN